MVDSLSMTCQYHPSVQANRSMYSGCLMFPWPDENLCGYVYAFSQSRQTFICHGLNGVRFEVPVTDVHAGKVKFLTGQAASEYVMANEERRLRGVRSRYFAAHLGSREIARA